MRVLVVDTYYADFLEAHYARNPDLAEDAYAEQLSALMEGFFGTSDAYSRYLGELGHEAADVVVNCRRLQGAWAREHDKAGILRRLAKFGPDRIRLPLEQRFLHRIAAAQIADFRPDVVYLQDLWFFSPAELGRMRAAGQLVVGQIASAAPPLETLRQIDLLVTSFPHFVERFRDQGIASEYLKIAFYEPVLDRLREQGIDAQATSERPHEVIFAGGLNPAVHGEGVRLLERVSAELPLEVWGYGADRLAADSPLLDRYRGQAWGLDMYRLLARSKIVINRHIDAAEGHANNMRLFEATGSGALLITEDHDNLREMFEPGVEVATYADPDELVEKIRRYLANDNERVETAAAGQRRTLTEHTYANRVAELVPWLERGLASR
jgi:spore maturation protein CgeB